MFDSYLYSSEFSNTTLYLCIYVCMHAVKLLLDSGVAFVNEFNHKQYDIESLKGLTVYGMHYVLLPPTYVKSC